MQRHRVKAAAVSPHDGSAAVGMWIARRAAAIAMQAHKMGADTYGYSLPLRLVDEHRGIFFVLLMKTIRRGHQARMYRPI
jgi:hypothetical protein